MNRYDIVIVGAGSAGIAVASSLLNRTSTLSIAIVDPANEHFYQPGWTMVGGGIFEASTTKRPMVEVIPEKVSHVAKAVIGFQPDSNIVELDDGSTLAYRQLIVCPGLSLNWSGIKGLEDALGKNGVTSNYRYDLAPYTFELASKTRNGTALFTQPPMPIKCAGAPQKAMYLSCDIMREHAALTTNTVEFHNAGPGLFGVADYVPALMESVEDYGIQLNMQSTLVEVRGEEQIAVFEQVIDGDTQRVEKSFDMLHVCPPQVAPEFIRNSPLSNDAGWLAVDHETLRHVSYANVHGLGDVISAPNAKTAAAARMQAPIVAYNVLAAMGEKPGIASYNGYGSCPLTVKRGQIVLAEFGYGGKLLPSFPKWLIDGKRPSKLAWWLKAEALPWLYWNAMLKGREWLTKPRIKVKSA